jgi:glyoxylase-like metal-dependent hydrolase (beta-lactamase superfamily II)
MMRATGSIRECALQRIPETALVVLVAVLAGDAVAQPPSEAEEIAPGIHLLRGAMPPDRGPDGNTVVFEAPDGLVVIDTGRHAWRSDAILAFAKGKRKPIAAIVNTHWHLDHSSGNGRIKAAYPDAPVYTTEAVDRALAPGGFLARNLESARARLDDPAVGATEKEEIGIFVRTMDERDGLRPDRPIERSGAREIAGRRLDVRVTDRAVTDADVWLNDPASGVVVVGDLVTLPAPFFETACPDRWRAALDDVWAVPFRTAIPGHGEPMSRSQFDAYRQAFNAFMDCVEGESPAAQCAADWQRAVAPLLGKDERMRTMTLEYAQYYVDMLRKNGGRSAECLAEGTVTSGGDRPLRR